MHFTKQGSKLLFETDLASGFSCSVSNNSQAEKYAVIHLELAYQSNNLTAHQINHYKTPSVNLEKEIHPLVCNEENVRRRPLTIK